MTCCKNCGNKLFTLECEEPGTMHYILHYDITKSPEVFNYQDYDFEPSGDTIYYCPHCGAELTTDDNEAKQLLRDSE